MNQTFNINRFGNLILRSLVQHKQIFLRLSIICVATFLVLCCFSALFNSNLMQPYRVLINFIIVISPAAFFFKKRTHTSHFFEFTLPASVLEKFLTKLLYCTIIFPAYFISISFLFIGITKIIPVESVSSVAAQTFEIIKNDTIGQYWNLIAVQSIFLCGSYFFKDGVFLKTFLVITGISVVSMIILIVGIFSLFNAITSPVNHTFNSLNLPELLGDSKSVIKYMILTIQYFIPVGLWFASFFKLKETEI
jgi:hypothetical protein